VVGVGARFQAQNNYGCISSPRYFIQFQPNPPPSGCPFLYVYNEDSGNVVADNNLLFKSEFPEFQGIDLKDLCKMNIKPSLYEGKYYLQLFETEQDYSYFDRVKLYSVDHEAGKVVGVTQNNDIVIFDSSTVVSTDDAVLNGSANITNYIQFNYLGKKVIVGGSGDSIYAHYDSSGQNHAFNKFRNRKNKSNPEGSTDSLAIIIEVGDRITPIVNKDYAGDITIYTATDTYTKTFARREKSNVIIIPFAEPDQVVDHVDVNWYSDYEVIYICVTPVSYTGFTVSEAPLVEAEHSTNRDILDNLLFLDNVYGDMEPSSLITLKFDSLLSPAPSLVRDFVFEVSGRYIHSGNAPFLNHLASTVDEKGIPFTYKLYNNYPNPFNPRTTIKYEIAKAGLVNIEIYNLLGQQVVTLVNEYMQAGAYVTEFDGTNYASGLYLYRIEVGDYKESKKMLLIK